MKVSYKRLSFVVALMVLWSLIWLLSPHSVVSRQCVDGVSWECKQILHGLEEKDRVECLAAIEDMERDCK